MRRFLFSTIVIAGALACLAGCGSRGPALYPVTGKVMSGDQPAVGALVVFHPVQAGANPKPLARVDEKGEFELKCDSRPGAPAGDYIVTVIWQKPKQNPMEAEPPDLLEGRYASPTSSKLRATVAAAPTVLPPFVVESAQ